MTLDEKTKEIQQIVGVEQDGDWGNDTADAVLHKLGWKASSPVEDREALIKFIDGHDFKYFKGKPDLDWYWDSVRHGVRNSVPPRSLWFNIIPTLHVLDRLRGELGEPVKITSSYRSHRYNNAVGGASQSWHTKFVATDIQSRVAPSHVREVLYKMRKDGVFKGGIGQYRSFTHVDTRGYNADWSG